MKLPRVRLTVRRLMIVVALAAAGIGLLVQGERWARRWEECMWRARALHGHLEAGTGPGCRYSCPHAAVGPAPPVAHHARMRRLYEGLAWRPWRPLPEDPVRDRYLRGEYVMPPPAPMFPVKPSQPEPK